MKVVIIGAGAVGSLFGARLARAGHAVELVGRPEHVAAIRAHGLRVQGPKEEVYELTAYTDLPRGEPVDVVLLTVKTFNLARTAGLLARTVPRPVPTLLPQNGLGVEALAQPALAQAGWLTPEKWTVRAVHSVPATLVAAGVVREAGSGEILLPDPDEAGAAASQVRVFEKLLRGAGFSVRTVRNFDREVWRKVLINAAINPVTAVRGVKNGQLLEEPLHREALALLGEALLAARAAGFEFSEAETTRDFERVALATAENRSSMLQDLEHNRPTEIDTISGEILRIATAHGLDLPATRAITDEVHRRAQEGRAQPQPS